ncbi:MAG: ABC transporter permease [Pirellulaceae bacterium]|nr:ABC transporter permease [Pirellulaceae bacterium]
MFLFRPLPWDYGVRNLFRRPARSLLTLAALTVVVLLVIVVVSFIQGLDASLTVSGDPRVVLVHSLGASENIENSTMPGNSAGLLRANIQDVQTRNGQAYVSPELYLGTEVRLNPEAPAAMGIVRGVAPAAMLVRGQFQLTEGDWPKSQEILVGRLAATKLGAGELDMALGSTLVFEGKSWRVAGRFSTGGSSLESEIWCRLEDLQSATKRQDLTLVALTMHSADDLPLVDEFCKERLDLEWEATPEVSYYASLKKHYGPVRTVAWVIVGLIGGAGAFAGLNTMYGAVVGRVREIAALQTIGFSRRAIALSIVQEAVLLASAGALLATGLALLLLHGIAVRFTMGAFQLRVDHLAVTVGLCSGVAIGALGAIPPAIRAMRLSIVDALKAI